MLIYVNYIYVNYSEYAQFPFLVVSINKKSLGLCKRTRVSKSPSWMSIQYEYNYIFSEIHHY